MPKDAEKKDFYNRKNLITDFLKYSPLKESLINDPELSKVMNLEDRINETQIVLNGKNEIIRLPEVETVFCGSDNEEVELEVDAGQEIKDTEGRRIVDLTELGKRLWCGTCKEALSLSFIEKECRRGLGSMLMIRCHKCLVINEVITSKMHDLNEDRRAQRFDINTDIGLCILNTGVSIGTINKVIHHFKIPMINQRTYKKYLDEIGEEEQAAIKARRSKLGQPPEEDV